MTALLTTLTLSANVVGNASVSALFAPAITTLLSLAGLVATGFFVYGGILCMTSTGQPAKLMRAKKVLRNAAIGLVLILAAASLTGILTHTLTQARQTGASQVPSLGEVTPPNQSNNLSDVLLSAIVEMLQTVVQTAAVPFITALAHFTHSTPLMSSNKSVFSLWMAMTGIADVLFVVVVILLGFHIMSAASLGIEEISLRELIPQLIVVFLLMNSSVFLIDGIISVSNAMISALQYNLPETDVWTTLTTLMQQVDGLTLPALLIFVAFIILSVTLVVYYLMRLVTLYIGAVLSPLVLLLWLLPAFKDFSVIIARTYIVTIFVLFIHVVILLLAASLLSGMDVGSSGAQLMAMLVGIATLLTILKTQHMLSSVSLVSMGARGTRRLGQQFVRSASALGSQFRSGQAQTARNARSIIVKRVPAPSVALMKGQAK